MNRQIGGRLVQGWKGWCGDGTLGGVARDGVRVTNRVRHTLQGSKKVVARGWGTRVISLNGNFFPQNA